MVEKLYYDLACTNHFHFIFHSSGALNLITSHHTCQPQRSRTCSCSRKQFCFTVKPVLWGPSHLESPLPFILWSPTHSPRPAVVSSPLWHCQGPRPDNWYVIFGTRYFLCHGPSSPYVIRLVHKSPCWRSSLSETISYLPLYSQHLTQGLAYHRCAYITKHHRCSKHTVEWMMLFKIHWLFHPACLLAASVMAHLQTRI